MNSVTSLLKAIPIIVGFQRNQTLIQRTYFETNAANLLKRIAAWGIDVSVTGVLATLASNFLGNDFQDPYLGPILLFAICGFLYGSVLDSSPWQGTLGKHLFRLKVVRTDGKKLSFWHAALRNLMRATVFLTVGLSYAVTFVNPQHASVHDFFSFTRVIKKSSPATHEFYWKPRSFFTWGLSLVVLLMSISVLLILMSVGISVVNSRSLVHKAYNQLDPYRQVVEKEFLEKKNYPISVTTATHGVQDNDLLPGSGHKARYISKTGTFILETAELKGEIIIGFFPPNHRFTEKPFAAWVCLGRGATPELDVFYSLLTPASCAMKPFRVLDPTAPPSPKR